MHTIDLNQTREFSQTSVKNKFLHESPDFKIINFNISAGQIFPVHSHDSDGQLSILVIEGEGEFLGESSSIPAKTGEMLICEIREPHGVKALTDMRIIVTIAPPF